MKINYRFMECKERYNACTTDNMTITTSTNYEDLANKPVINSIELIGSISLPELGLRAIYYDTTANWNAQGSLIAEEGTIYIYSDYSSYDDGDGNITPLAGIKIGDGNAYLIDMPFVTDGLTATLLNHINNHDVHVTQQERTFWNNKVSSYMDPELSENLILSKTHYELEGELYHG